MQAVAFQAKIQNDKAKRNNSIQIMQIVEVYLYPIVPIWYASVAYQPSLVEVVGFLAREYLLYPNSAKET